jgi:hypothetical protein
MPQRPHRRGATLLIVLALLALFAAIAISFVYYADSHAAAAALFREGQAQARPDVDPELLLAYFLGQLIYDADDTTGLYSALRGHSLARLLYGWNDDDPGGNVVPFNGTGPLHEPVSFPGGGAPTVLDGYDLVNYTCFRNADGSLTDGFIRDPERLGTRSDRGPRGPYTGGFNAPYTYPDRNNLFLAAAKADGTVLVPSFHRPWLRDPGDPRSGFGSLDPRNPNWYDRTKPWLRYLVLRPRPADHDGFPPPEDAGGDVKNLVASPGGNDSIWLDLDFPVLTARDGRRYKPLFAPLILDLDNRVNVNVHGNVRGAGRRHLSNQGWGPWEVNPGRVLTRGNEWANLLLGSHRPPRLGRYGKDAQPGSAGKELPAGPAPHAYAQADFDAANGGPGGAPTGALRLPGLGASPFACLPSFPAGYGNGSGGGPGSERWQHPALGIHSWPASDDRRFAASDLEALLRYADQGSPALTSELFRLCPTNFSDPRSRRLVTVHSSDLDRPGVTPWLFDRAAFACGQPLGDPYLPAVGPPVPFPPLALRGSAAVPGDSDFRTPGARFDSPAVDWRSQDAALGRVDLNRFLPPYPHQGRGLSPAGYSAVPLTGAAGRFDADPAVRAQFLAAQAARQQLADDIYRRLLAVTGVPAPATPASPGDAELAPRRWLAQLAVNIVDFLDEDDVSTPFNFYTARDAGDPSFDPGGVSAGNPELPRYWVFGTELPRVVLNEVLTEYQLPPSDSAGTFPVRVWVELFNPLPAGPHPAAAQQQDAKPVPFYVPPEVSRPGYSPFRIVLASTNPNAGGPLLPRPGLNDNVLGTPDIVRAATEDAEFASSSGPAPQGFILLGPPGPDARDSIRPRLPAGTPWLQSPNLQFAVSFTPPGTWIPDERPAGVTVLLRRLANPHLPYDPRPAVTGAPNPAYNPHMTIDYLQGIPLNNATSPQTVNASRGRRQPYAADPSQVAPQSPLAGSSTWHTLGRRNDPVPGAGRYDWLVHLDRRLISPMELLHVSGYPPHQLTQRFISRDPTGGPARPFNHRVPWFDQANRLYRVFEYLTAQPPGTEVAVSGRGGGKINLNTVWDPETFRALCDAQPGSAFTAADVDALFQRLLALRTPDGKPGPADRPFLGMAAGFAPAPGDPLYPPGGVALFPAGSGINDTFLRSGAPGGGPDTGRLLQIPAAPHPYLRDQLLIKIFNRLTTRSNVFAVWLTVGFFEVKDDRTRPVKLGPELGRAECRHVRHRMFAIIDRTGLRRFTTATRTAVAAPGRASVLLTESSGTSLGGGRWGFRPGSVLWIEPGTGREEAVTVQAVDAGGFVARFARPHPAGSAVIGPGNPGPQPGYDPRRDPGVVLYLSIID